MDQGGGPRGGSAEHGRTGGTPPSDQGGGPRGGSAEHGRTGGTPPSEDEQFYREYILDHYKNPRNFGRLESPTISHEEDNPLCGDIIGMDLAVKEGRIADVRFHGRGCAISQASASLLTERIKGLTVEEARKINKEDVFEELGIEISPARIKCALLSLKVLKVGAWGLGDWSADED